jgi:hypothetical protein
MKRSLYFILPAVFAFNIPNVHALEIDEKLTLRFLNVSATQKTVLINRGGEDGLVVGDHAKFFITAGVIARGVAEKVSPSRSVWSLYRIVDPTEIVKDKVLNLKIATPVKITDDPSKSLKEEPIPGGTDSMSTEDAAPAASEEVAVSDEDRDELKGLGFDEDAGEAAPAKSSAKTAAKTKSKKGSAKQTTVIEDVTPAYATSSKSWEVWGTMYVNALSGTVDSGSETSESTSATASAIDFSGGIEKYFVNNNNFLKEFSILAFIHKKSVESGDTIQSKTDWLEYGLGVNYHFYNSAAAVNRLIGYGGLTVGKGTATVSSKTVSNNIGEEQSAEGSNTFFTVGVGAKYVLSNGFGVRASLDYYSSNESYEFEETTTTRTLAGPRVQFGLSYRF